MKLKHLLFIRRKAIHILSTLFSLSIVALVFQNCSQGDFNVKAVEDLSMLEQDSHYSEINTSRGELPKLKLFFIVDNSYTMEANQLNLSDSFGKMFEESSNSLSQFDSEVYITSTSQLLEQNIGLSSLSMQKLQALSQNTLLNFNSQRWNNSNITGNIPGDLLGFDLTSQLISPSGDPNTVINYQLNPAMVLEAQTRSDGNVDLINKIEIKKGTSTNDIKTLFNDRLNLLKPSLYKDYVLNNAALATQRKIVENESGLCALGRILKHKENLFENGDLLSFVIVSDEDDSAEKNGFSCVDSREVSTTNSYNVQCKKQQTNLVARKQIITPRTQITYTYNAPSSCVVAKKYGFKASATVISAPATTSTSYNVSYNENVCTLLDGNNICSWVSKTKSVPGPLTGDLNLPSTFGLSPDAKFQITHVDTITTTIPAKTTTLTKNYTLSSSLPSIPTDCSGLDLLSSNGYTTAQIAPGTSCSMTPLLSNLSYKTNDSIFGYIFDGTSASCDTVVGSVCSGAQIASANCSKQSFTNAALATNSSTTYNGVFNCDSLCSEVTSINSLGTSSICGGNNSGITVANWLITNRSSLSCTTTRLSDSITYSNSTKTTDGSLTCDSLCKAEDCNGQSNISYRNYFSSLGFNYDCNATPSEATANLSNVSYAQIMTQCPSGYSFKSYSLANSSTSVIDQLVTGSSSKTLSNYISEKFLTIKPILTVFTNQANDTIQNGASEGKTYNTLADALGGKKFSINLSSYAPALQDLGQIMKERMLRSYKVSDVDANGGVISRVWKRADGQVGVGNEISIQDWTQAGNTLIFSQNVIINEGDIITVEYKNPKSTYTNTPNEVVSGKTK